MLKVTSIASELNSEDPSTNLSFIKFHTKNNKKLIKSLGYVQGLI